MEYCYKFADRTIVGSLAFRAWERVVGGLLLPDSASEHRRLPSAG